jgi:hypothetical protein
MAHRRATTGIVLLAALFWPAAAPARWRVKHPARVRAALLHKVQRHPEVLGKRWFLSRAGLVAFKLPVTLRVRPGGVATADLGASLGARKIALGGSLAAAVTFSDTFDGGALGDVGIEFRQSDSNALRTSSIPLLWNEDASACAEPAAGTLTSGDDAGNDDSLGPAGQPFPVAGAQDTVLRTNALRLQVAGPGTGPSGGHANLFGNIPGRNVSVDVTLSLQTVINAIVRVVDADAGDPLECRQLWTGAVANTIPGIRLAGSLQIAPAITPDGHLRIAKVTVASPPATAARTALSACLLPVSSYTANDVPADRPCGGEADPELGVATLAPDDGAQVTVAGDITVDQVSVDVIIGDA